MSPAPRTLIIVPAFNEAAVVAGVVDSLSAAGPHWDIIVVNDASSDATGKTARSTDKARVIDLCCNLGIGGAVQTGFKLALAGNYDFAVQVDGDGQHDAADIASLLDELAQDRADVAIGSRFLARSDAFRSTAARRLGIRLLRFFCYCITGRDIRDVTSGFRAYNRKAIQLLAPEYPSDFPEPEAIVLLARHGLRMREIAVAMRPRQAGKSSIGGIKSAYYMIKVVLAMLIAGMRSKEDGFLSKRVKR